MELVVGIIAFYLSLTDDAKLAELLHCKQILEAFIASLNYHPESFFE